MSGVTVVAAARRTASTAGAPPRFGGVPSGRRLLAGLLFAAISLQAADGPGAAARLHEVLPRAGSRAPGSAGNLAVEREVADIFADSGFAHGRIRFTAPAFRPGRSRLDLDGADAIELHPLHPSLMRPGNFTVRRFRASLVYLGAGRAADLAAVKGTDLKGAVAVMDFDCGARWLELLRFGVRGFIFLGQKQYYPKQLQAKVHASEVAVPRFLTAPRDTARLRAAITGGSVSAVFDCEPSRWQRREVSDLWAFIPGTAEDLGRDVVTFTAPLDANCVAPGLAYGGQAAANLEVLMDLLDTFRRQPPAHSVLLAAVNAHTQFFRGERMLGWFLLQPAENVEGVRNVLAERIRRQRVFVDTYDRLHVDDPTARATDAAFLKDMRTMEDKTTGKPISLKGPVVALAKRDVNQIKARKLKLRRSDLSAAAKTEQLARLQEEYERYVSVLTLFNKVGVQTELTGLSDAEVGILAGYIDEIRQRYRRWVALNEADLRLNEANDGVRQALAGRRVRLVISLDLSWDTDRIGFLSPTADNGDRWARGFGVNAMRIYRDLGESGTAVDSALLVDTLTNFGGLPQAHYFPDTAAPCRFFHACGRTPALALKNCYSDAGQRFAPSDRLDRLDGDLVGRIRGFLPVFFLGLLADEKVTTPAELPAPRANHAWSMLVDTFKFDEFAASVVPELPVANSFFLVYDSLLLERPIINGDVAGVYGELTDERASAEVYAIDHNFRRGPLPTAAYHLADDGVTVDHAIDAGDVQGRVDSNLRPTPERVVAMFPCRELPIRARADASRVSAWPITVADYLPLDAQTNTVLPRYGLTGASATVSTKLLARLPGPAAVYAEPDAVIKLIASGKRLNLNADAEHPQGTGVTTGDGLGDDFFAAAARDARAINVDRLAKLHGVSNEVVDMMLTAGGEASEEMETARQRHDHLGYLRALYAALGAEIKAYEQVTGITNDMLKAVVFYLALLLPFCFFIQKLIFNFVRIETQLVAFAGLFVVSFWVFRLIHPAFQVAQAPAAIFIAFVMLALGGFVIKILHSRFEGEMQLLFLTYTGMDTGEVGYSTVGQKAMLIGVNNMKRRRVRTALTTATIVLVTFTMLAFSSVSKKMSPTLVPVSKDARYTGIFYQWPGNMRMDEATLDVFDHLFCDQADVIVRRWLLPEKTGGWQKNPPHPLLLRRPGGGKLEIDAALGLARGDADFLGAMPLLAGGRYFSADDAQEALLPAQAAKVLNITREAVSDGTVHVDLLGHSFQVVGILDDERFRTLTDLNLHPLLPIKDVAKQGWGQADSAASSAVDPTAANDTGIFYVSTAALLVLPIGTAADLGAQPFSVSVRFADDAPVWPQAQRLLTMTEAKFFIGSRRPFKVGGAQGRTSAAGVYYVGSNFSTRIGGLASLIIPLLIAGTIILNTMLGAVYERKSEIAVYNAIGLNPTHIAMFFLAEAFVYSVIGSVAGYLIGQLLSLAMIHFHLVSGVNLNFSSLAVVYVILFTIVVVMLSTLYPALVATRAAVPSGKRKWSLPDHDGNRMEVVFPFIYPANTVAGIMGYIDEYFQQFTEASIGELIASLESAGTGMDSEGRRTYRLELDLALAPFDLGVTQKAIFDARFDEIVDNYRVTMTLRCTSGQDAHWIATNKPFLEKLRRHMLHWRNLDPAQHALYVQHAQRLFAPTAEARQPTPNEPAMTMPAADA